MAKGQLADALADSGLTPDNVLERALPTTGKYGSTQRLDITRSVEVGAGGGVERGEPLEDIPVLATEDMPGMRVEADEHLARLFRPVGKVGSNVFKAQLVPLANATNCLKKRLIPSGHRAFYQKSELPQGYVLFSTDDFPYACGDWVDHCNKKLDTAQKLNHHILNWHTGEHEIYKEDLEALMKEESKMRREKTKGKRESLRVMAQRAIDHEDEGVTHASSPAG